MRLDEEDTEYLYKVMTTARTACGERKNLDCKGWDTILSAANTSIALVLFGGI